MKSEDLSIDASNTTVGLILTKLEIYFLGVYSDGQTDTILESAYGKFGNISAHKIFQLKAQNQELAVDSYMHPQMMGMHNNNG